MQDDAAHWRAQAQQARRLVAALSDQKTIASLQAWVAELDAKIAEADQQEAKAHSTQDQSYKPR